MPLFLCNQRLLPPCLDMRHVYDNRAIILNYIPGALSAHQLMARSPRHF
ncbi:unnamed protein product [Chondrus crispus]|uniref:Uncharacterized protein n=1 Tax=Chondrus crispus TaxID=2769 RepID=R7Q9Y9_CHOCR|nr:unnamed protein product [Chondrus crispus]CDF34578.1 unnamed protein product [Chondrus crispus]|eukprot:XP_005714397.1 unnamed protein product [Chondrus crispus]